MLAKIARLDADGIIVDLEDGVAPREKETARRHVREAAEAGVFDGVRSWMLRINPVASPWHDADGALAEAVRPPRVLLPKAEDPIGVAAVATRFAAFGIRLGLVVETALGVANARALATAHPAVDLLVIGSADLRSSLGGPEDAGRAWERHALAEVLLAARLGGCEAIDGVYFRFRDDEGLRRHAAIGRALGYDGKSCIHPSQIAVIHEVYASTAEERRWAERVVAAWKAQDGDRQGIVVADGEMIEGLHLAVAERILARP